MMVFLYHQNSADDIRRTAVLVNLLRSRNFEFEADAAPVVYNANDVILATLAMRATELAEISTISLGDAYRKVVEQIRQAEAHLTDRRDYEEPIIEEEDIEYPKLRDIDTRGIRRLRR